MSESEITKDLMKKEESEVATIETESQRAVAEVQAAMILARRFPRDEKAAYDKIMTACERPSLAEKALYEYSKGGTGITGPSIRLAEAIAQIWGNINFGVRELSQRNGESTVESYAWDIESNTRQVKQFQVPHIRYSKAKGNTRLTDPRDIYEAVANQGARRLRACILGIIPGDIVEAAVEKCEETMKAKADTSPAAQKKLVEVFAEFGVTKEMIEEKIQRHIDAITPGNIVSLRKIYNSMKDGMSSPIDWFKGAKPEGPNYGVEEADQAELNELFDALGMNQAQREMELGKCKGDKDLITALKASLSAKIKEKAVPKSDKPHGGDLLGEAEEHKKKK